MDALLDVAKCSQTFSLSFVQQSKVYQYGCHHTSESYSKYLKSKEKADSCRAQSRTSVRTRKAEEKEKEVLLPFSDSNSANIFVCNFSMFDLVLRQQRQRQYFEQRHRLLKTRNDYLLQVASSNARTLHYYTNDVKELIEVTLFSLPSSLSCLLFAGMNSFKTCSIQSL